MDFWPIFGRCWPRHGPQMGPTWPQLGAKMAQLGVKMRSRVVQKSDPKTTKFLNRFLIDFGRILGRFLEGFGPQVEGQVGQKIDHVTACFQVCQNCKNHEKNPMFFSMILGPSAFQLGGQDGSKIDPKSIKN